MEPTQERRALVMALYDRGYSYGEIARRVGVTRAIAYNDVQHCLRARAGAAPMTPLPIGAAAVTVPPPSPPPARSGVAARGFGSMDPERQRAIAASGGRAAHEQGTAHQWTPEEASAAGHKSAAISRRRRGEQ